MVVIELTQQVATNAELTALAQNTLTNGQLIWHTGESCFFMYYPKQAQGEHIPDDQANGVGVWKCEPNLIGLDLVGYKKQRYKEIEAKTDELILNGFAYQGKVFSLSEDAQINILALDETRDDPALSYPITYNTIDDLDSYSVADSTDLHNMYLTALATKKTHVDSGSILKESVRDAVDEAAVLLIVDNR